MWETFPGTTPPLKGAPSFSNLCPACQRRQGLPALTVPRGYFPSSLTSRASGRSCSSVKRLVRESSDDLRRRLHRLHPLRRQQEALADDVHLCPRDNDALLETAVQDRDPLELRERLLCLHSGNALKMDGAFYDGDARPSLRDVYVDRAAQGDPSPLIVLDAETTA